jgi:hypothetical protein
MRIGRSMAALVIVATVFSSQALSKECLLGSDRHLVRSEDGTPVQDDDVYSVEDARANCGKKTSFLDTYGLNRNVVSVTIGGTTHKFLPLALYDKTSASNCNRIKVRSACFNKPSDRNVVELYDQDTPSKGKVTFTFDGNGDPVEKYGEYALIRADFVYKRKKLQTSTRIHESVKGFQDKSSGRTQSCADPTSRLCLSNKEAVAENVALERLRVDRFLHIASNLVTVDRERFNRKFNGLAGMEAIIKEMLLSTELGTVSPYELSDATKGASALSFGARQLDIGGNDFAKEIFSANLGEFASNGYWAGRAEHRAFIYARQFQAPIQAHRVRQLYLMHDAMPALQDMMRTPSALDRLDDHHSTFLRQEAQHYAELRQRPCFRESPFLALVAIDRSNQRPKDLKAIKAKVAEMCSRGAPLIEIERTITQFYGDYTYRAVNIRKLIERRGLT